MAKIRVSKEFSMEIAHALWNYDGKCKYIHGHSYLLQVTLLGEVSNDADSPKLGMVVDFSDLKKVVKTTVVDVFDHALVLNKEAAAEALRSTPQMFGKMYLVDYQPTCENMLLDFVTRIKNALPPHLQLHSALLRETRTSFAEWYASDNV